MIMIGELVDLIRERLKKEEDMLREYFEKQNEKLEKIFKERNLLKED